MCTSAAVTQAAAQPRHLVAASDTARSAGHILAIRVTGLARGYRSRIRVTGPNRFSRAITASTTLHSLRPGKYALTVSPARAPRGGRIFPASTRLTAQVTRTRAARVVVRYVTLVPKTTVAVRASTITTARRLSGGRTRLKYPGSSKLKIGAIVAAAANRTVPHGLLAKVIRHNSDGSVVTKPATLLEAVPEGQIDSVTTLNSARLTQSALRSGLRLAGDGSVTKDVDGPLADCKGSVKAEASGSISIAPSFHLQASWSWLHGVTSAKFTADVTESSVLKASIEAAASCAGSRDLFAHPVTFATFVFDVGTIPIVVQPQLQITLDGKADVHAAVTTSATQNLTIGAGMQWQRGKGVSPITEASNTHQYKAPSVTAKADVKVSVNPEVNLLIDGVGGPEFGLTGGLELSADKANNPWWELDGFLEGNVGILIPLLHFDKRATLVHKKWVLAHAAIRPEPSITVYPDLGFPWGTGACGDYAGDTYVDVSGSHFVPGETVTVYTGWGLQFSGTASSDGSFYLSEPIGEVANADYTAEDVWVDGSHGSYAYASMELNANSYRSVSEDSNGNVTMQWCGNGYDTYSELDLMIDGSEYDYTYTDGGGSGGTTTTFTCPDSGDYSFDIEGTDNGHGEHISGGPLDLTCSPPGAARTRLSSRRHADVSFNTGQSTHR